MGKRALAFFRLSEGKIESVLIFKFLTKLFDPRIRMQSKSRLFLISGIPPSDGGTGQLVAHLQEWLSKNKKSGVILIARPDSMRRDQFFGLLRALNFVKVFSELIRFGHRALIFHIQLLRIRILFKSRILMLHPQNLGYGLALKILKGRKATSTIFLLDSSFFCVASYNHLHSQFSPCFSCLSKNSSVAREMGCAPFPRNDEMGFNFTDEIKGMVRDGSIKLLAQNEKQAMLAAKHFELKQLPKVVGLWSKDWVGFLEAPDELPNLKPKNYTWDIVFHGHLLDSKGVGWLIEVAKYCPTLNFLFPFSRPSLYASIPKNCEFQSCSWEDGLKDIVMNSRYVAVPSLWSAPIEGSLIKSIVYARGVIVANNETAFCGELPEGLIFTASSNPKIAAEQIGALCESDWIAPSQIRNSWVEKFCFENEDFAEKLFHLSI